MNIALQILGGILCFVCVVGLFEVLTEMMRTRPNDLGERPSSLVEDDQSKPPQER